MSEYNRNYFEKGLDEGISCYLDYKWLPELTIPMVARIIEYLGLNRNQSILDFGCAKGFTVKALRLLHFNKSYGVDISRYAIDESPEDIKEYLFLLKEENEKIPLLNNSKYDWVISKDVLEHIDYNLIDFILYNIRRSTNSAFFIIPLGDGEKFNVPDYEKDKTHKIRESREWWIEKFKKNGFTVKSSAYKVKYIKENWSFYEKGNGFFVLT